MYSYYIETRSGGTPERVFLHFFGKGFWTRARKDIYVYMYSRSEETFLQRRKTVLLFASIKGPTCCMEDHMRKVLGGNNCKTLTKVGADVAFLQYSTIDSALQHFPFLGV